MWNREDVSLVTNLQSLKLQVASFIQWIILRGNVPTNFIIDLFVAAGFIHLKIQWWIQYASQKYLAIFFMIFLETS